MKPNIFIAGISSDIGRELGFRFSAQGWKISGSYRTPKHAEHLPADWETYPCDISIVEDVDRLIEAVTESGTEWSLWINAIGVLDPIGPFFDISFAEWRKSILCNCLEPLGLLHRMWDMRRKNASVAVGFFAGAGTNGPAPNYSAYCASKIFLIKMTELLADEYPEASIFIVGPGMVKTRIHEQTLHAAERAGQNLDKVEKFLNDPASGVTFDEVFECLNWCLRAGGDVVSGRNISLVGDPWKTNDVALRRMLRSNSSMFKLRRSGNAEF